jgi:hypothetical protein
MSWSSTFHHDAWHKPVVIPPPGHLLENRQIPPSPTVSYRIEQEPTASNATSAEREVYHGLLPFDTFDNTFMENLIASSSMAQIRDWYCVSAHEPGDDDVYSSTIADNAGGIHDPENTPSLETTHTRKLRRNDAHVHEEETTNLRCFEHGCNGRRFSNKDNLRRHFRERSVVNRADCYFCGITFSRKSNRDAHIASGRCQVVNNMFSDAVDVSQDNK